MCVWMGEKSPFVTLTVRQCTIPMASSVPARGGPVARHTEAGPGGSTNDLLSSHKCSVSAILVVVEIFHLQWGLINLSELLSVCHWPRLFFFSLPLSTLVYISLSLSLSLPLLLSCFIPLSLSWTNAFSSQTETNGWVGMEPWNNLRWDGDFKLYFLNNLLGIC